MHQKKSQGKKSVEKVVTCISPLFRRLLFFFVSQKQDFVAVFFELFYPVLWICFCYFWGLFVYDASKRDQCFRKWRANPRLSSLPVCMCARQPLVSMFDISPCNTSGICSCTVQPWSLFLCHNPSRNTRDHTRLPPSKFCYIPVRLFLMILQI